MKQTLITIVMLVIVGTSGLVLAQMVGKGGGCCSVHNHQMK